VVAFRIAITFLDSSFQAIVERRDERLMKFSDASSSALHEERHCLCR
jgi:hypothetical protein